MVLTPTSSYDNTPGLCVPASPPPQNMSINQPMQMQNQVPRGNTTIYSSRPPPPPTPTGSYSSSSQHQQRPRSPARPKLSRENVAKVGKDSRFARWERVLGYVREQRAATLPEAASAATNITPALAYHFSRSQERKRRADEFAAMDARNQVLDRIDLAEQDSRSLWSGGSGGTNGVDEFVWSEDEDDDVMPMPQAPTPMKVLPEEFLGASDNEGIFECEMQIDYSDFSPRRSMHSASHEHLGEKRGRPQSTPEEMAFQRLWGKRIVEEMPSLCREGELEGGLGRLVGRRMSAAY